MIRPTEGDYPSYCRGYVGLVPETDVLSVLETQLDLVRSLGSQVTEERETFAYAPGKWTIRDVVGHLGDCDRVFGFRALAFSRSDVTRMPGFDENAYVANANFSAVPLVGLVDELALTRLANLRMFHRFRDVEWNRAGTANGNR